MQVQDMIWVVYETIEDEDPVAVFATPRHASAFAWLDDERVIGRLDNETAAKVRPSPVSEEPRLLESVSTDIIVDELKARGWQAGGEASMENENVMRVHERRLTFRPPDTSFGGNITK